MGDNSNNSSDISSLTPSQHRRDITAVLRLACSLRLQASLRLKGQHDRRQNGMGRQLRVQVGFEGDESRRAWPRAKPFGVRLNRSEDNFLS